MKITYEKPKTLRENINNLELREQQINNDNYPHIITLDLPTKSHLVKPNKTIKINGIDILFPYQPYGSQIAFMKSVIECLNTNRNGLLESPTGTGKTLSILCATIAWINHQNNNAKPIQYVEAGSPIKIIYCSRTHSQLHQVVKELKASGYNPKMSILASRDRVCLNGKLKSLHPNQLQAACRMMTNPINNYNHKCEYYENYENNHTSIMHKLESNIYDIEEIIQLGSNNYFCPYYYEKNMEKIADITLMPYNYLLDSNIRQSYDLDINNKIIIIDEAHNIDKICEDSTSFDLSIEDLKNSLEDLNLLKETIDKFPMKYKTYPMNIEKLVDPIMALIFGFQQWKNKLDYQGGINTAYSKNYYNKTYNKEKNEILTGVKFLELFLLMTKTINIRKYHEYSQGLNKDNLSSYVGILKIACQDLDSISKNNGGLNHFLQCIKIIETRLKEKMGLIDEFKRDSIKLITNHIGSYYAYCYTDKGDQKNFKVSFVCCNPGISFNQMMKLNPKVVLLISGSLPMELYEEELFTEFPIKLKNQHVIDTRTQVYTAIIKRGYTGKIMNFAYKTRDDNDLVQEAGITLLEIVKIIPKGLLVFFGSYALMDKYLKIWDKSRILDGIKNFKQIFTENKYSSDLGRMMEDYTDAIKRKGAIFFGVCRGKISEGIDFIDDMARAVVLIGIPFPCVTDKKVELKREYLNDNARKGGKITGSQWYFLTTMNALHHAMGRIIRHIKDYGTILLMDERYSESNFMNAFPSWTKDNMDLINRFDDLKSKLESFYKNKFINQQEQQKQKQKNLCITEAKVDNNQSYHKYSEDEYFKVDYSESDISIAKGYIFETNSGSIDFEDFKYNEDISEIQIVKEDLKNKEANTKIKGMNPTSSEIKRQITEKTAKPIENIQHFGHNNSQNSLDLKELISELDNIEKSVKNMSLIVSKIATGNVSSQNKT